MKKIAEYREHAAECRRFAAKAERAEDRDALTKMAETWESLARDRERQIAQQQRISELERLTKVSV
jgi:hypothetical protein